MIPRPPAIPASLAALVTLAGLGLIYWSLTGLGLLRAATAPVVTGGGVPSGGGFGGGSAGPATPGGSTGTPSGGGAGGGF